MTLALLPTDRRVGAIGSADAVLLRFAFGGGRTFLVRQHVPYPMHVTRPFQLDISRPDLVTLYLQSSSGGLYRGDSIDLSAELQEGSAVHLTTQAATVVHNTRGSAARHAVRVRAAPGTFLALTPDPLILFPGAALQASMDIQMSGSAAIIASEGFATHDPDGAGRPFAHLSLTTTVRNAEQEILVGDRSHLSGADLCDRTSPLGPYHAFASILVLGPKELVPSADTLNACQPGPGCEGAASSLPNSAGTVYRLLAESGGALARGMHAIATFAMEHVLGFQLAIRRK